MFFIFILSCRKFLPLSLHSIHRASSLMYYHSFVVSRYGMFTSEQLSNFTLLLHHLCRTQTLFGDNHPLEPLDSQSPYQERQLVSDLAAEDRDGARTKIISVSDFHISFIEYCIKLKLVNLLYHYMDFYR